jgi:small subunit ribosomal protein S17
MKNMMGIVVSNKMQKTVVVIVERPWKHPVYQKIIRKVKKYLVHDEINCNIGDQVIIEEIRPISKRKHWKISKRLEKLNTKMKKK